MSSFHGTLRSEVFRTVPELFPSGNTSEQTCSPFSSEHFGDTSEHFGRPSRSAPLPARLATSSSQDSVFCWGGGRRLVVFFRQNTGGPRLVDSTRPFPTPNGTRPQPLPSSLSTALVATGGILVDPLSSSRDVTAHTQTQTQTRQGRANTHTHTHTHEHTLTLCMSLRLPRSPHTHTRTHTLHSLNLSQPHRRDLLRRGALLLPRVGPVLYLHRALFTF